MSQTQLPITTLLTNFATNGTKQITGTQLRDFVVSAPNVVATITALRTITPPGPCSVSVNGNAVAGDGGGGAFYWGATLVSPAVYTDDGNTVIIPGGSIGSTGENAWLLAWPLRLNPTAVQTSAYTALWGDFVLCDTTSAAFTVTLPTAPQDGTRVGVKIVTFGTGHNVTVATAGSDVFNKSGGSTTLTLQVLNQGVILQYQAATRVWVVMDALPYSAIAGGVTSFNTRTGAVVPATSDYSFAQISGTAGLAQGGTNANLAATGGSNQVLQQSSSGAAVTPRSRGRPAAPGGRP